MKGKIACQETGGRAQAYGAARREIRVIWLKLDCLNPNLQKVQMTPAGKTPETGAGPCGAMTVRAQSSGAGAMPSEGIQGDGGEPKSR